jgi:uronate dehydrogenase
MLRRRLPSLGFELRSSELHPLEPLNAGEQVVHGDLRDAATVDALLKDIDVLVHMAGTSVERPLDEIIDNNLRALCEVYEGARRNGVRRVVFASSNHAFGMYPTESTLTLDAPYRPDGFYGLSKVWGEALAQMYWDKHGIEGVSLRIGTCHGRPPDDPRQLSTWLGEDDLVQLVTRSIEAEGIGHVAVWGISANTRSYYDLSEGNDIGYEPRQDAEVFAAAVEAKPNPLDELAQEFQGGSFATWGYTPPGSRRPSGGG